MHIDWWTLALQAINVLILIWLLARFCYRPVMKAITDRQSAAATLLGDAAAAKQAAVEQQVALDARNKAFAAEADKQRTALHVSLDAERAELLAKARTEAEAETKRIAAAAAADRARMAAELEVKAGELAGRMAAKLLGRLPPAATTDAFFAALAERLRDLPEDERQVLAAEPVTIVTPAALDAGVQADYAHRLAALLPNAPAPRFAADPALIAGFELRAAHVVVRNSWRADLDGLVAALREDGHARLA